MAGILDFLAQALPRSVFANLQNANLARGMRDAGSQALYGDPASSVPITPAIPMTPYSKGANPANGMLPGQQGNMDLAKAGDNWSTNEISEGGIPKHYVLPSQPGDRPPSGDGTFLGDAALRYQKTGQHYGAFDTDAAGADYMNRQKAYAAPTTTGGILNAVPESQRALLQGMAAAFGPQAAIKQAYQTNVPNVTGQEENYTSFDAANDPYKLGGVGQINKRTGQVSGYIKPEKPTSEETPTIKNAKALGLVPGTKDFNDYIRQDTLPRPQQPTDSGWSFLTDPGNNNHPYRANARTGQALEATGNAPYVPKGMSRVGTQGTQQLFTPEQAKFYAQQALAGDKSVYTSVGRNAAARTQIAQATVDLAKEQGLQGADLAAINAAFLGDQAAQRVVGQRTGAITVSGQEAKGVANLVNDAYAKLPRDQFRPFNQLRSLYETQTSSPEQAAAYMADFSLQTAYARALNPSGIPRESDIAKAEQLLNGAQSQEAHKAVVDQILREIQVIENSTGAARVTTVNRIRNARGLGNANLVTAPAETGPSQQGGDPLGLR